MKSRKKNLPKPGEVYRFGKFDKTVRTSKYKIDFKAYYFTQISFPNTRHAHALVDLGYLKTAFSLTHFKWIVYARYYRSLPVYFVRVYGEDNFWEPERIVIANHEPKYF